MTSLIYYFSVGFNKLLLKVVMSYIHR